MENSLFLNNESVINILYFYEEIMNWIAIRKIEW